MYYIEEQYEYYGPNGKEFTKWFRQGGKYNSEQEALEVIKKQPKIINKLKHNYRVCLQQHKSLFL